MNDEKINLGEDEEFQKLKTNFVSWYIKAKPYDWYAYHSGMSLHQSLAVEIVRQTAWEYATKGLVYLFQVKDPLNRNCWHFMCQKSKHPTPRLVPKSERK